MKHAFAHCISSFISLPVSLSLLLSPSQLHRENSSFGSSASTLPPRALCCVVGLGALAVNSGVYLNGKPKSLFYIFFVLFHRFSLTSCYSNGFYERHPRALTNTHNLRFVSGIMIIIKRNEKKQKKEKLQTKIGVKSSRK